MLEDPQMPQYLRTSSRHQRRFLEYGRGFQGKRGRNSLCPVGISNIFLTESIIKTPIKIRFAQYGLLVVTDLGAKTFKDEFLHSCFQLPISFKLACICWCNAGTQREGGARPTWQFCASLPRDSCH